MDEAQIASRLTQNIPQEPTVSNGPAPIIADTQADTGYVDNMPFDELTKYKLCEQFNIPLHEQSNPETTDKLSLVYAWAATVAGSEDYLVVQSFLHNVDNMVGYSQVQSRLDRFYQYAKLDLQRRKIEKEMQYA
jgi:hypothetical protein